MQNFNTWRPYFRDPQDLTTDEKALKRNIIYENMNYIFLFEKKLCLEMLISRVKASLKDNSTLIIGSWTKTKQLTFYY